MSVQTSKFERKPFYVEAVRVTEENIREVAEWCKGTLVDVDPEANGKPHIHVDVHMPMNDRQTQAFYGDWVLFANKGFKVYQNKSFWASFVRAQEASFVRAQEASEESIRKLAEVTNGDRFNASPHQVKKAAERKVNRSSETGQFVDQETVDENPATTTTETVELPTDAGLGEKSNG